MPVALSPVGLIGMHRADGEIHAARAAERFGVPFTLSTMSICSLEDVAKNTKEQFWFQLYVMRDREFIGRLIERARNANCSTLVVTVDIPTATNRGRDIRNGLSVPRALRDWRTVLSVIQRPRWVLAMLQSGI